MVINKRIVAIMLLIATLGLFGCSNTVRDAGHRDETIQSDFTQIPNENYLYYCNNTGIVYWIGGRGVLNNSNSYMTVYYAPNGLPYKYEDGRMVEIDAE